jgi:histidinol-phosphate aminotransferase
MTLRLHYNENTAGCSHDVLKALASLTVHDVATYENGTRTIANIARWLRVPDDCVLPVNGLDEGILIAAQLAALESRFRYDAVIVEPAFEMYAEVVKTTGGDIVRVPPAQEFTFDAARVLAMTTDDTRIVFLCDPNNPTGLGIARSDIEAIADALPRALVFVDEAYADFSGRTLIDGTLEARPNIVIGRTFAKAHGLAGLRIGALVAAPATILRLRGLALPYRINVAAAVALRAALADRRHLAQTVDESAESRRLLRDACGALGLATWKSEANFVLVRIGERSAQFARWMETREVRVRDRSSLPGCRGCVRITAGPVKHTQLAISLLEEWHATQSR